MYTYSNIYMAISIAYKQEKKPAVPCRHKNVNTINVRVYLSHTARASSNVVSQSVQYIGWEKSVSRHRARSILSPSRHRCGYEKKNKTMNEKKNAVAAVRRIERDQ